MLHAYYENANHLNNIHLSACWISLATLAAVSWAEQAWLKRNVLALDPLVQHTIQSVREEVIEARTIATTVHRAARSGTGKSMTTLFVPLATVAERRMGDFNSQALANTAWAFATVSHKDQQLFTALAAAAEWHMGDFNPQALANTAWAFATASHKEEQLFTA